MASKNETIEVPASWFAAGYFPGLCAKTGVPTDERRSLSAEWVNPLAYCGLLLGAIGMVILMFILRKRVTGSIPVVGGEQRPKRKAQIGSLMLFGGMGAMVGLSTGNGALVILGVVGFVSFIVGLGVVVASQSAPVGLKLSKDQQWVTMSRLHPDFAAATRQLIVQANNRVPTAPPAFVQSVSAPF